MCIFCWRHGGMQTSVPFVDVRHFGEPTSIWNLVIVVVAGVMVAYTHALYISYVCKCSCLYECRCLSIDALCRCFGATVCKLMHILWIDWLLDVWISVVFHEQQNLYTLSYIMDMLVYARNEIYGWNMMFATWLYLYILMLFGQISTNQHMHWKCGNGDDINTTVYKMHVW